MKLILRWAINALAILGIAYLIPGIEVLDFKVAIIAALVLGLVNAFIGTFFKVITLPLTILTLGLTSLIINAFMLWLTAQWISGFIVEGFWAAISGALVMWLVSWATNVLLKK